MRTHSSIGPALLMVLASTLTISATETPAARFTFARPPAPASTIDPAGRLAVDLDRWSTDAERDRLFTALATDGQDRLLDALRDVGRIGTLRWPGGLEYGVRYARSTVRPDGGTDLVLLVDRPLWLWWESTPASTRLPYSVVQVRIGKDGAGEGRVSLGVAVSGDKALGVVLSNYATAPAVLADVRRERQTS